MEQRQGEISSFFSKTKVTERSRENAGDEQVCETVMVSLKAARPHAQRLISRARPALKELQVKAQY